MICFSCEECGECVCLTNLSGGAFFSFSLLNTPTSGAMLYTYKLCVQIRSNQSWNWLQWSATHVCAKPHFIYVMSQSRSEEYYSTLISIVTNGLKLYSLWRHYAQSLKCYSLRCHKMSQTDDTHGPKMCSLWTQTFFCLPLSRKTPYFIWPDATQSPKCYYTHWRHRKR